MKSLGDHFDRLQRNRKVIDRVQSCQENNSDLNDWEDTFLESLNTQLIEGRVASALQLEKLDQIEHVVEWGRESYREESGDDRP